jgi:hypothetical protein
MTEPVKALSAAELPDALKAAFAQIYTIDTNLAALKSVHIEPVADERTTQWRNLKAATGIARKDLELYYKLYKRDKDAEQMDDEDEGKAIKSDLRRLYAALAAGETLDWLGVVPDVADATEPEEDGATWPDNEFDHPADSVEDEADEAVVDAGAQVDEEPSVDPEADWGSQEADASDAQFDGAGEIYNIGAAAGKSGGTPADNPYPENDIRRSMWERGRKQGIRSKLEEVSAIPGTGNDTGDSLPFDAAE